MTNEFKDKVILITGGAGSIGSALVREILKYDIKTVRILDSHSSHCIRWNVLYLKRQEKARFSWAMLGIDIAYKRP